MARDLTYTSNLSKTDNLLTYQFFLYNCYYPRLLLIFFCRQCPEKLRGCVFIWINLRIYHFHFLILVSESRLLLLLRDDRNFWLIIKAIKHKILLYTSRQCRITRSAQTVQPKRGDGFWKGLDLGSELGWGSVFSSVLEFAGIRNLHLAIAAPSYSRHESRGSRSLFWTHWNSQSYNVLRGHA